MASYLFYIILGLAPSVIWLLFYLRKDAHPEPNRMIITVFFLGAVSAGFAAFLETGFFEITKVLAPPFFFSAVIDIFLGVALIEELLKYTVVRFYVLRSPEFNEPIDAMLYMIIAALGFAALENTLILWFNQRPFYFLESLSWSAIRFLGATFLHALCSGIVGYFLALSYFKGPKGTTGTGPIFALAKTKGTGPIFALAKMGPVPVGLILAVLLHGLYNFSIMKLSGSAKIILPVIVLLGSALFVSWGFKKLKKLT